MTDIRLFLPIPVTLNKIYHNNSEKRGGGRAKTKRSKAWVREARFYAQPFVQSHAALCNENIAMRNQYWNPNTKSYDLRPLHKERPTLSYEVWYDYSFENPRAITPCDLFNFEKLLTDFLVDCGFMLDDSFIDEGHVKRLPPNKESPRVEIKIKTIDLGNCLY